MKILLFVLLASSSFVFGQFSKDDYKNLASVESGFYHRGLIGVSYSRLFKDKKHYYFSAGGGLGIGTVPFGRAVNQFYYLSVEAGAGGELGHEPIFFCLGLDYKYLDYFNMEYNNVTTYTDRVHYKGVCLIPNLILTVEVEKNIWVKMRSAPLYAKRKGEKIEIGWGIGLSVGKRY